MKLKITLCFLFLFFTNFLFSQNFGSFASGIKVSNIIYNTTASAPVQQINPAPGALNFDGVNLGVFGQNSICAKITGGEIKTWKNALGNVCSVVLNWRVYPAGSPSGLFNTISLSTISECNLGTGIFNDGLGPCGNGDQKWKDYTLNSNFISGLIQGNYVLEIYFSFTGSDTSSTTCETTRLINNSGANFKATFTISNPTCSPTVSSTTLCEGDTLTLTANPANGLAPYIYSWTGPNGYTSSAQNPTIITTVSNSGVYMLTVTDSCGAVSTIQSTASVVVNPKVTPVFDALYPAICNGGIPPVLPNLSTNGITGTWNPAVVSNTVTGTYVFTPDSGQCANTYNQLIFVVNNVTPSFTFPTTICVGSVAPILPSTSSNGIVGTWNPTTINNTTSGSYVFTPTTGQCATPKTVNVTVNPVLTPSFNIPSSICVGATAPILPTTSNNGITGTWSPSTVSNTTTGTYTFTHSASQCSTDTTVTITVNPNITPTFNAIAPICQNATAPILPTTSTNGITGTWSPSTVSNTTSGVYTFTPNVGQCGTSTTLNITVNPNILPQFNPIPNVCYQTTAPILPLTSTNGITGTWFPSVVSNTASGTYTFTPTPGVCALTTSITITVNKINPTFNSIAPICSGTTAPVLTITSINGITGTWSPSVVSNTTTGTYTFTPDANQCATTAILTVTVNQTLTPTFTTIAPICQNATAPILPTTSNNGITGTWNPSTISNISSGSYIFTPNSGQCATSITINVVVNPNITPTFNNIAPICQNAIAPILPTTSTNGITGTWSPSVVSNTTSGMYTFTPTTGLCATTTTLNVTVNPNITPTFNSIPQICSGAVAPTLSTTSTNGITGTWSPSVVSNTTSGTYTFTPTNGLCATTTILNVTVNPNITPTFDPIPPVCYGSVPPTLPLTSLNGITGTWNPSTVSNTNPGTYTFTPSAGQCAVATTIGVTINSITPTFNTIPPICNGSTAPTLPLTSLNGIAGTWSPVTVSNTTSAVYTFTPNTGQCALITTISITVNTITPTFNAIPPICYGSTSPLLATTSNNGITGTWSPSTISNTVSGTYIFTPNVNQCAVSVTINTTINSITPAFNSIAPICQNTTAQILPTTSTNGITGTWTPSTVSNTSSGSYTFTPAAGQCAITTSLNVTVTPNVIPQFDLIPLVCYGSTVPTLPTTSNNGITGTWSPSTISNTTSGNYVFTPNGNICATTVNVSINVNTITPLFDTVQDVCYGSVAPVLPLTSNNGITGTWSPTTVSNTLPGVYTFTPNANQCAITTNLNIGINQITPSFDAIAPICQNSTAPILSTTSNNGITGTWLPSTVSDTSSGSYTFTPAAGQCATTTSLNVTVTPNIVPQFDLIPSVCYGSSVSILPTTSNNGISGTWSPSTISNTVSGIYTFTPNGNICATTATLNINVNTVVPAFDVITNICENSAAPILPLISDNGISGTWSPSIVDNANSAAYVFTPNVNQCASPFTINITVSPNILPLFDPISDVCYGSTAPVLPLTSTNGITGTWNPSVVSNLANGNYIFTPNPNQCATIASLNINMNTIVPTFEAIPDVCYGSTSPILPLTSTNGISGTWNPSIVDNLAAGIYTFTPDANQCATNATLNIGINVINPTFDPIADVCYQSTPPVLPLTSTNGITGTWNPTTVSNISSGIYTFTPASNQCATTTTLNINVNSVYPTFSIPLSICENNTPPVLVLTSDNGITGLWSPAIVSNTTSGAYVFTPDANQCALVKTLNITVNPNIVPDFNVIAPICENSNAPILPLTSTNGITGTWNPATISNTTSGTYIFTPDVNQCATQQSLNVYVTQNVVPTFSPIASICANSIAPVLPLTSNNGIHGSWSPSIVSNLTSATYTFTADSGICATQQILDVTVVPNVTPVFSVVSVLCNGETNVPLLPLISDNGISGTWSPSMVDNTSTGSYTFTPTSGICALTKTITITVLPSISLEFVGGCKNGNYELQVSPLNNSFNPSTVSYVWHDMNGNIVSNATTNILNVTSVNSSQIIHYPLSYSVTITTTDNCSIISVPYIINDAYCDIQKGISPNGDGLNDTFDLSQLEVKQLEIFNRYGIKVYSKAGYTNEWGGQTDNGNELPDGTYYYVIEFNNGQDSKTGWIYINKQVK